MKPRNTLATIALAATTTTTLTATTTACGPQIIYADGYSEYRPEIVGAPMSKCGIGAPDPNIVKGLVKCIEDGARVCIQTKGEENPTTTLSAAPEDEPCTILFIQRGTGGYATFCANPMDDATLRAAEKTDQIISGINRACF